MRVFWVLFMGVGQCLVLLGHGGGGKLRIQGVLAMYQNTIPEWVIFVAK